MELIESRPGNGGELALQGRGHGRGHGFRRGPGQVGGHQDGGKIDVGQIAHRQETVAHDPEEQDGQHDQGGHDRTPDEEFGEVHCLNLRHVYSRIWWNRSNKWLRSIIDRCYRFM